MPQMIVLMHSKNIKIMVKSMLHIFLAFSLSHTLAHAHTKCATETAAEQTHSQRLGTNFVFLLPRIERKLFTASDFCIWVKMLKMSDDASPRTYFTTSRHIQRKNKNANKFIIFGFPSLFVVIRFHKFRIHLFA